MADVDERDVNVVLKKRFYGAFHLVGITDGEILPDRVAWSGRVRCNVAFKEYAMATSGLR